MWWLKNSAVFWGNPFVRLAKRARRAMVVPVALHGAWRMITLGINAAFHDCSACLVENGVVRAAAEEERFTRVKHGKRPVPFTVWQLPFHAIAYCLSEAGLT